jgi:hypothetical protein
MCPIESQGTEWTLQQTKTTIDIRVYPAELKAQGSKALLRPCAAIVCDSISSETTSIHTEPALSTVRTKARVAISLQLAGLAAASAGWKKREAASLSAEQPINDDRMITPAAT